MITVGADAEMTGQQQRQSAMDATAGAQTKTRKAMGQRKSRRHARAASWHPSIQRPYDSSSESDEPGPASSTPIARRMTAGLAAQAGRQKVLEEVAEDGIGEAEGAGHPEPQQQQRQPDGQHGQRGPTAAGPRAARAEDSVASIATITGMHPIEHPRQTPAVDTPPISSPVSFSPHPDMSSPVFNYQSGAVISSGSPWLDSISAVGLSDVDSAPTLAHAPAMPSQQRPGHTREQSNNGWLPPGKYDESTNEDDLSDFPETVVLEASVPATPLAHSSQQAPSEPFPDLCDPHTEVDAHSQVAQDETHTVLDSQLVHSEGAQRDNTRLEADGEVTNHDVQSDDSPSQTHVERNSSHGKEADTGALDTEDDPARSVDDFRPAPPTHLNTAQFFKRDDILSRTDSFPLSLGDTAQDVKSHEVDPPQTLKPTLSDTAGTQQPVPDRAHDDGVSFFDQLGSSEEQLLQDSVSSDAPDDESAAKSGIMNAATGAETAMPQDAAIREMVVASEQGSDPTAPSQEANATEPVQIRCDHDDGMPDHHSAQPQPLQQPTEAESRFDEGVPLLGSQQPVQRRSNTTMSALKRHDRTISAIFRADGPAEEEETFLKAVLEVQNTAKHSGDTDEAPPPLRRKSTSEVLESISARDRRASRMMDTIAEDPASDTADTPDGTMAAPEVTEEELAQRWRVMGFDDDDDEMLREDAIPEAVEGVSVTAALMPSASTLPEPSSYVPTPPADIGYNDYFGRIASQPITHYSNGAVHSPYMSPPVQALPAHTPHEYQYAPHQPSTADLVSGLADLSLSETTTPVSGHANPSPSQVAPLSEAIPTSPGVTETRDSYKSPYDLPEDLSRQTRRRLRPAAPVVPGPAPTSHPQEPQPLPPPPRARAPAILTPPMPAQQQPQAPILQRTSSLQATKPPVRYGGQPPMASSPPRQRYAPQAPPAAQPVLHPASPPTAVSTPAHMAPSSPMQCHTSQAPPTSVMPYPAGTMAGFSPATPPTTRPPLVSSSSQQRYAPQPGTARGSPYQPVSPMAMGPSVSGSISRPQEQYAPPPPTSQPPLQRSNSSAAASQPVTLSSQPAGSLPPPPPPKTTRYATLPSSTHPSPQRTSSLRIAYAPITPANDSPDIPTQPRYAAQPPGQQAIEQPPLQRANSGSIMASPTPAAPRPPQVAPPAQQQRYVAPPPPAQATVPRRISPATMDSASTTLPQSVVTTAAPKGRYAPVPLSAQEAPTRAMPTEAKAPISRPVEEQPANPAALPAQDELIPQPSPARKAVPVPDLQAAVPPASGPQPARVRPQQYALPPQLRGMAAPPLSNGGTAPAVQSVSESSCQITTMHQSDDMPAAQTGTTAIARTDGLPIPSEEHLSGSALHHTQPSSTPSQHSANSLRAGAAIAPTTDINIGPSEQPRIEQQLHAMALPALSAMASPFKNAPLHPNATIQAPRSQEGSASTEPQQPADALCDQYVPTQNHAAESHTSSSGPMVRLAPANTATDHQTALGKSQSPEIDMPYHPVLNASHSLTETPELARVSPIEASHLPTSAPSRPPETAQSSSPVPSATLVQHVQGVSGGASARPRSATQSSAAPPPPPPKSHPSPAPQSATPAIQARARARSRVQAYVPVPPPSAPAAFAAPVPSDQSQLNDVTTPVNLASGHDESMPNNASSGYDPPGEPYEPSPQAALGCASPNGEASGYQPLSGTGAEQRPLQSAQGTASSNGRSSAYNAVTTGYQPLSQSAQGYTPPSYEQPMPDSVVHSVQGYAPPSYEPPSFGYEPPSDDTPAAEEHADSDDEARKPKQRSMMDDDDDDDFQKRAEALKREERARHDREAAERVRKAAEEDAKRAAAKQSQKKGWFSGWFGSKKENEPGVTVHRAKLGEKNNFYYDKELGRWVNKKDPSGAQPAVSAVPPPPRAPGAGPPRGPPQAAAVAASTYQSRGPPMSAPAPFARPPVRPGLTIPPSAAGPPVSATASQVQAGPSPYAARPPTSAVSSPVGGAPPSAGPKPAALAGANSIDDLLGATPAPRVHGGRSKKKGRGYVDVMAN